MLIMEISRFLLWKWRFSWVLALTWAYFVQRSASISVAPSLDQQEKLDVIELEAPLQDNQPCAVDVLFVLDGSSSVKDDFEKMRDTVIDISSLLNVGPYTHRVALLEFSGPTRIWPQFPFGFAKTTPEFVDTVKRMPYIQGTTLVGRALSVAKKMLEERRRDVETVVLVITDGFSQDSVAEEAAAINEMPGVVMFALEIPETYYMDTLVQIAGNISRVIVRPNILEKARQLLEPWLNCTLPLIKLVRRVIPTTTTTTTTTTTATTTTTTPAPTTRFHSGCELDLVIVMDSSSSVINHFNKYVDLTVQIIQSLNIGSYYTRVALIQYASQWRVQIPFHLNTFSSKKQVLEATRNIFYTGGTTNTAAGLSQAITELQDLDAGARPGFAKQAVVVFTDGFSQHDPRKASDELRKLGVTIFVIAEQLGNEEPNLDELWAIAGDKQHVFSQSELSKLMAQLASLSNSNCRRLPADLKPDKEFVESTKLPFRN